MANDRSRQLPSVSSRGRRIVFSSSAGGVLICYSKRTVPIHENEVTEMNATLKCCLANIVLVILLFLFSVCKLGLSASVSILPGFVALMAANVGIILYSAKK